MNPPASPPIRVALVCTELGVGGAERCVARLATGLDRSRFSPHVVVLAPPPEKERAQLVDEVESDGVPISFLNLKSKWQWWKGRQQLQRLLRDERVDVVQSFLFHANVTSLFATPPTAAVSTGIRVADPRKWRHRVERWASRRADAIVCVSQSVQVFCQTVAKFDASKLRVIPNGIPLEEWPAGGTIPSSGRIPSETEGKRFLLCVGRLHYQKGYDWLLAHVTRLLEALPDHHLVIVGDGPDRDSLSQAVARCSIAGRIHLLGQRSDVPHLLAACDMLLLPSRWEGMPNVVLEAMASSKPVVASQVEGVLELLGDELSEEQTAPFGDVERWAKQIESLASNPAHASELGGRNRVRVEAHFGLQAMVAAYSELFESLYAKRKV